jgi:ketosteroid isomerase-like protein
MKVQHTVLFLTLLIVAPLAMAHGDEKHAKSVTPGRSAADAKTSIQAEASDAVAVVERFSNALGAGDLEAAARELDPKVLILESGGAERSRDEYLSGHAGHDAEFLKGAQITLKHRVAHASGSFAWVASESEIHAMKGEDMLKIASTETMLVRKSEAGWKIVHIHWSSRAQR